MINAKELRIGNLVLFHSEGNIFTVEEIMETGLSVSDKIENTWIEIEEFSSIPLTEEWLLRLGFERMHGITDEIKYKFAGKKNSDYSYFITNDSDDGYVFEQQIFDSDIVPLTYLFFVHQLQNLYFALTGKELQYNL